VTGDAARATPADLARIVRGQWGIESVHWPRDTVYGEDSDTGYAGNGPQVMTTLRNIAIILLHLPASPRPPVPFRPSNATAPACSATYRYKTPITNDFAHPVAHSTGTSAPAY
jgi:hypothetical protein